MTSTEFNHKYEFYIEPNYEGLEFDYPLVTNFLDNLFETRLTKIKNFNFAQIKLKFGTCRFYSDTINGHFTNAVEKIIDNLIMISETNIEDLCNDL